MDELYEQMQRRGLVAVPTMPEMIEDMQAAGILTKRQAGRLRGPLKRLEAMAFADYGKSISIREADIPELAKPKKKARRK